MPQRILFAFLVCLFAACQTPEKEATQNPYDYKIIKDNEKEGGYIEISTQFTRVKKGQERAFLKAAILDIHDSELIPQPERRKESLYCLNFPCYEEVNQPNPILEFVLLENEPYVFVTETYVLHPVPVKNVVQFLE